MSNTITHDGVEYVAKSHVDEIVRQRIAKYSEKLTATESQLSEYQARLDEASAKIGLVDNLTQQVESLRRTVDTNDIQSSVSTASQTTVYGMQ